MAAKIAVFDGDREQSNDTTTLWERACSQ